MSIDYDRFLKIYLLIFLLRILAYLISLNALSKRRFVLGKIGIFSIQLVHGCLVFVVLALKHLKICFLNQSYNYWGYWLQCQASLQFSGGHLQNLPV